MRVAPVTQRVLRLVPLAGSGETVSPGEVAGRLGMTTNAVCRLLHRAAKSGLVVRVRQGAYQLANKGDAMTGGQRGL